MENSVKNSFEFWKISNCTEYIANAGKEIPAFNSCNKFRGWIL